MSRTTLYSRIEKSPHIRKAGDLTQAQIDNALRTSSGDIASAAQALEVSERGLKLRMKDLADR